jgi:DNA excision repair protein ERCC-4
MDFVHQAFAELYEDDGLLVMARGLGLERVLLQFLKLHCNSNSLVFVLNCSKEEMEYFCKNLRHEGLRVLPRNLSNDYSPEDRAQEYLRGGVLFVPSRLLVVDLLTRRLPAHVITGFLVNHAHRVDKDSGEAFALHLFRQNNERGFVKAFSDCPEALLQRHSHVQQLLRILFVRRLYLWPRFHATVGHCLETHQPEVVELHQPLTSTMRKLQEAIVQVMHACIQELKMSNHLDLAELTIEDGLLKSLHTIIRRQLQPVWHVIGAKTKQLLADLRTLSTLLSCLLTYDCVAFNRFLETLRTHEFGQLSTWLFLEAANNIFALAKSRVYVPKVTDSSRTAKNRKKSENNANTQQWELVLEENPKWGLLADTLKEIQSQLEECSSAKGENSSLGSHP